MTTITMESKSMSQTAPINLSFHVVATLNMTAEDARRQINQQVVPELGTGLRADEPLLVIAGEQIAWRVPIVLSLPMLGNLGQVGTVDVDAYTGDILALPATRERIIQHALHLYQGATLSAK